MKPLTQIKRVLLAAHTTIQRADRAVVATVDHLVHVVAYVRGLRSDQEQISKRLVEESGRRAVGFRAAHDEVFAMRRELNAALSRIAYYEGHVPSFRRLRDQYEASVAALAAEEAARIAAATPPQPEPIAPHGVFVPPAGQEA